jgi:hypothetical protein
MSGVALLLLVVASVLKPVHEPYGEQPHYQTRAESTDAVLAKAFWGRTVDDPVAYWTLWLMGFTGILAAISIGQMYLLIRAERTAKIAANAAANAALATKSSVDRMKDTAERQLRAYLSLRRIRYSLVRFDVAPNAIRWEVEPEVQNSGSTPALDMFHRTGGCRTDNNEGLPADFDFGGKASLRKAAGTLGPQCERTTGKLTIPFADMAKLLRNDGTQAFLWGEIDYSDVFPGTELHQTWFAVEVKAAGFMEFPDKIDLSFVPIGRHDKAT